MFERIRIAIQILSEWCEPDIDNPKEQGWCNVSTTVSYTQSLSPVLLQSIILSKMCLIPLT